MSHSEDHWRHIAASTRLLGDMGQHVLFGTVLWHANCRQLITFRRAGDLLQPDFSRLERYVRLVARKCCPQRQRMLDVWGHWLAEGPLRDRLHLTDDRLQPFAWSSDLAAQEPLWRVV